MAATKELILSVIAEEQKEKKNKGTKMQFGATQMPIGKRGIIKQWTKRAKSLPILLTKEEQQKYDAKMAPKRARRLAHRLAKKRNSGVSATA